MTDRRIVHAVVPHTLSRLGVTVTIQESDGSDGAVVVFIDTTFEPDGGDDGPGLRVLINDDDTYIGVAYEPLPDDRLV